MIKIKFQYFRASERVTNYTRDVKKNYVFRATDQLMGAVFGILIATNMTTVESEQK